MLLDLNQENVYCVVEDDNDVFGGLVLAIVIQHAQGFEGRGGFGHVWDYFIRER